MPIVSSNFKGNKWNKNKHLETIIPALFRKIDIAYERERVELPDGDFMDLDYVMNNSKNLLILFHGLEGSSNSQYIKGFSKYFSNKGFDICAVNFRSCSGENNRLLTSYHSGKSDDIDLIINYIVTNKNYSKIMLGGFSLGGNVLLKYLGEQAEKINPLIKTAFAFSVPIDLAASSKVLSKNWNKPYMVRLLKSLNKKLVQKANQFPNQIDLTDLYKINNFKEWDTRFTSKIHGFENADDYYHQCSSLQFIDRISIPTLLVNALNDPFLAPSCFPFNIAKNSKYFYLETPEKGGHVGFALSSINGQYYSEHAAYNFTKKYL